MWNRLTTLALAASLSLSSLGSTAEASTDGWRVSLSKSTRHGSIGVDVRGGGYSSPRRAQRAPRAQRGHRGHRHGTQGKRLWVEGCYETQTRKVWVPATWRDEWVPAVFETRYDSCGRAFTVEVRAAYCQRVRVPGYWDHRATQVWRPGYWRVVRY